MSSSPAPASERTPVFVAGAADATGAGAADATGADAARAAQQLAEIEARLHLQVLSRPSQALKHLRHELETLNSEDSWYLRRTQGPALAQLLAYALEAAQGAELPEGGWRGAPRTSLHLEGAVRQLIADGWSAQAVSTMISGVPGLHRRDVAELDLLGELSSPPGPQEAARAELLLRLGLLRRMARTLEVPAWKSGQKAAWEHPGVQAAAREFPELALRVALELLREDQVLIPALRLLPEHSWISRGGPERQALALQVAQEIQRMLDESARVPHEPMHQQAKILAQVAQLQDLKAHLSGYPLLGSALKRHRDALELTWPGEEHLSAALAWDLAVLQDSRHVSGVRELLSAARPDLAGSLEWWAQLLQISSGWPRCLSEHLQDQLAHYAELQRSGATGGERAPSTAEVLAWWVSEMEARIPLHGRHRDARISEVVKTLPVGLQRQLRKARLNLARPALVPRASPSAPRPGTQSAPTHPEPGCLTRREVLRAGAARVRQATTWGRQVLEAAAPPLQVGARQLVQGARAWGRAAAIIWWRTRRPGR